MDVVILVYIQTNVMKVYKKIRHFQSLATTRENELVELKVRLRSYHLEKKVRQNSLKPSHGIYEASLY